MGAMVYVNGSNSAMVIDGEIPGNAPPSIPQATPANAANIAGVVVRAVQA